MDPRYMEGDHVIRHLPLAKRQSSHSGHGPMSPISKSSSVGSINSDTMNGGLDQDDIFMLTKDVQLFSDALANLKCVFSEAEPTERGEELRTLGHERLRDVLVILTDVRQRYPALHSANILEAATILIASIRNFDYDSEEIDLIELIDSIDQLALAFSSSVSEYLMGDVDPTDTPTFNRSRSFDSLPGIETDAHDGTDTSLFSNESIDQTLLRLESGVDIAFERAKAWSKYTKEIMSYVEQRGKLEADFARGLNKLASNAKPLLTEEGCLPLQSAFCTALNQDTDFANTCQATINLIHTVKFTEPLNNRRQDHERTRKHLKDKWTRETRKLQDAVNVLKKARNSYVQRRQEYEAAHDITQKAESDVATPTGKLDKKKKLEDEAFQRAKDAESFYKSSVIEANNRQHDLEKVKANIIAEVRDLIYHSEETLKNVAIGYFQLHHTVCAPLPVLFQALAESCQSYEPGAKFAEYVRGIPMSTQSGPLEPYSFQPYPPFDKHGRRHRKASEQSSESTSSDFINDSPQLRGKYKDKRSKYNQHATISSDTESISGSSSRSRESSPSASPALGRPLVSSHSVDQICEENKKLTAVDGSLGPFKNILQSPAARSHALRKLRTPGKCRECESYVYFNGAECAKCGMAWHKKCLEICTQQCGQKSAKNKLTTFGVDISKLIKDMHLGMPYILLKCVNEIEERGLQQKGLYRVSGVKSKVERLCQKFELEGEKLDLSDEHPNVIANVLKLFLRQLPEPLLTFQLYPEFIKIIKEDTDSTRESTLNKLGYLVKLLPRPNFRSLGLLVHHLNRVSTESEENQMSTSNLGIVFGPTLLRPKEGGASLSSLVDTPQQTRAIDLMVQHSERIFGPANDFLGSWEFSAQNSVRKPRSSSADRTDSRDPKDQNANLFFTNSPTLPRRKASYKEKGSKDRHTGRDLFDQNGNSATGEVETPARPKYTTQDIQAARREFFTSPPVPPKNLPVSSGTAEVSTSTGHDKSFSYRTSFPSPRGAGVGKSSPSDLDSPKRQTPPRSTPPRVTPPRGSVSPTTRLSRKDRVEKTKDVSKYTYV